MAVWDTPNFHARWGMEKLDVDVMAATATAGKLDCFRLRSGEAMEVFLSVDAERAVVGADILIIG